MGENCALILQYSGGQVITSLKSSKIAKILKPPAEVKIKRKPSKKSGEGTQVRQIFGQRKRATTKPTNNEVCCW